MALLENMATAERIERKCRGKCEKNGTERNDEKHKQTFESSVFVLEMSLKMVVCVELRVNVFTLKNLLCFFFRFTLRFASLCCFHSRQFFLSLLISVLEKKERKKTLKKKEIGEKHVQTETF